MESSQRSRSNEVLLYFSLSFAYIGVVIAASELFFGDFLAVLSIIVSVPIMATYGYQMAIRRTFLFYVIKDSSKIKRFLSGFLFRIVVSFILSVLTSSYILLSIADSSEPRWYFWTAVGVSVPLMLAAYKVLGRIAKNNFEDFTHNSFGMVGASLVVSLFLTIFFGIATNYGTERPFYDSFWSALDAQLMYQGSNPIVGLFFELYRFSNAVSDFGLSILRTGELPGVWYISVYLLHTYLFFVGFTSAIAIFLVGRKGVTRIFAETNTKVNDSCLPPLKANRRLWALAATVSLVGLYFYLFFGVSSAVERIGDNLVLAGTIERIQSREERNRVELSDIRANAYTTTIEPEIHAAFETIRDGVPHFLDWYYSLPAELGRVPLAVLGKLEQRFLDKMLEHLSKGDPFSDLVAKLEVIDQVERTLNERTRQEIDNIVSEGTIAPPKGVDYKIDRSMSATDLADIVQIDTIPFSVRLGTAMGTGAIVGIGSGIVGSRIASRIVARAVARGTVRRATQAVVSAGTRVAAGAAVGTAVAPPVGTVVGAIAGVSAAILVDFGILKLEEYLSRDELESEIMEAIRISERKVLLETERLLGIADPVR